MYNISQELMDKILDVLSCHMFESVDAEFGLYESYNNDDVIGLIHELERVKKSGQRETE